MALSLCPAVAQRARRISSHSPGAEDVMELLEEDLTCPICCSLFDDPRVLPCSHNFCKKCLEGILDGNVRNMLWRSAPFKCPTCRKEVSATGVSSLQVNYSLKGIVEKYNKIKVSPKMPVCKGHVGQPLNIFCLTDMQLICGVCATRGEHTKHVFCSIEDAYAQERNAFESLFQGFETWRRGDALSRLDSLETGKRKSLQLLTKDSDKVKEFFEKLLYTLEQKKNEILSDFETMKLEVMQAYDPEINKLNTILQEQRMAFNIAEAFKDVSEPIVFLQQMQEFREKIKVIKETPLPSSNLPASPMLINFDTSHWEGIKLVDVDKLSLPQEASNFISKIPRSFQQIFVAVSLLGLLLFFTPSMSSDGSLFDSLLVWKGYISSIGSCYLTESTEIANKAVAYWEQMSEGIFLLTESCKSYSFVVLNSVAEFVCRYKLL
ncbi:E3 ubiquitin-protein ligase TRIM13 isoform X1 [Ornithorhynchus anatinus]|uniref:Tripartite motif containing 13 n=2 Tax=Ornithorhynchus anatinus TaxID=9258 RepID=A0A6I8PQF5_ORNAN|nr:E3 ubiquitin-protein ligase TRIM13 isoform X1 [Ornithorhynchus anatinus]XP_016083119.1 E3 ubiquitin-protein ligase TRIM13 isoform X1 [Ornithorhynchus anatinus]XP_028903605.1 E3 ubiquitin-protein ligase TRIM13 isoform X1 [Ornithorhynchus anatinus]XP_028903606.1 E3 ubiquitin-protein ligase TRIM13 isoform X1 [Ornithorhynchus anatinus]